MKTDMCSNGIIHILRSRIRLSRHARDTGQRRSTNTPLSRETQMGIFDQYQNIYSGSELACFWSKSQNQQSVADFANPTSLSINHCCTSDVASLTQSELNTLLRTATHRDYFVILQLSQPRKPSSRWTSQWHR